MKETAPKNIKMTELSKIASDSWKNSTEEEKAKWKRLYEINRDLPNQEELSQNTTGKVDQSPAATENFQITSNSLTYGQAAEGSTSMLYAGTHSPNQHYDGNPEVYAMTAQFSQPQQTFQLILANTTVNPPIMQNNFVVDSPVQTVDTFLIFYQPSNDHLYYQL